MGECLVIPLEGVLAKDATTGYDRNVLVYRSLAVNFRTVIVTTWDRPEAQRWLRTEQIRYDLLLDRGASILGDKAWRLHCLREVMSMSWPIGLYLDADPDVTQDVLAMGITTLLVSARVRTANWMPSQQPPRQWDNLVAFQDQQREADGEAAEGRRGSGGWPGEVNADVS